MEKVLNFAAKQASPLRSLYGKTEDQYLDLVRRFPLRPLRGDADLDAAIAMIDSLIDRPKLAL
jgi:HTH-type transcriptional regulator/antitoxin HigA